MPIINKGKTVNNDILFVSAKSREKMLTTEKWYGRILKLSEMTVLNSLVESESTLKIEQYILTRN